MRIVTGDAIEVHFALRLLDRSVDHAYCYNYPNQSSAEKQLVRHLLEAEG